MGLVTLVLAGSQKEYDEFLLTLPEDTRHSFRYARDDMAIRGLLAKNIIKIGTWYMNPNAMHILEIARTRIRNTKK